MLFLILTHSRLHSRSFLCQTCGKPNLYRNSPVAILRHLVSFFNIYGKVTCSNGKSFSSRNTLVRNCGEQKSQNACWGSFTNSRLPPSLQSMSIHIDQCSYVFQPLCSNGTSREHSCGTRNPCSHTCKGE